MKTIHVAVAGLGRIGKIHLKNLARNFSEIKVLAAHRGYPVIYLGRWLRRVVLRG